MPAPTTQEFRQLVWDYYRAEGRMLPWRGTDQAYEVFVSEIMLQQTQVSRVEPKYVEFLRRFPTVQDLAEASVADLLASWQGLGYNRRALNMQRAAKEVVERYDGIFPQDQDALDALPGIGPYTAGAIRTFAFNLPSVFIETNIRRAYLHQYFPDEEKVEDKQLLPLIASTQDLVDPRGWYYALMDYGAWLGRTVANPNKRSAHYGKQSAFAGSKRQLRGAILRLLTGRSGASVLELAHSADRTPQEVAQCMEELAAEGFLEMDGDQATLAGQTDH